MLQFVRIRQHTSAYVSIRQHPSAYVSIRQHTCNVAAEHSASRTLVMVYCPGNASPPASSVTLLTSRRECASCCCPCGISGGWSWSWMCRGECHPVAITVTTHMPDTFTSSVRESPLQACCCCRCTCGTGFSDTVTLPDPCAEQCLESVTL